MEKLLPTLLLLSLAVALPDESAANTVFIKSGRSFIEHLCLFPHSNINLVITVPKLKINEKKNCFVENISNITIAPSLRVLRLLKHYMHDNVEVECHHRSVGFSFFNVTNLSISSVTFNGCGSDIPKSAVKYVDNSEQFLHYDGETMAVFIFNYCFNITLHNLIPIQESPKEFSIIGVNLCGDSTLNITTKADLKILLYYTDSEITSSPKCHLHVKIPPSRSLLRTKLNAPLEEYLSTNPSRMWTSSIANWFTLMIMQQGFDVAVDMAVTTTYPHTIFAYSPVTVAYINAITDSQVTFKGYEKCNRCDSLALNVLLYETPLFKRSNHPTGLTNHPLIVEDIKFVLYTYSDMSLLQYPLLRIKKFPGRLSHEVLVNDVSWYGMDHGKQIISDTGSRRKDSQPAYYPYLFSSICLKETDVDGDLSINIVNMHLHDLVLQNIRNMLYFSGIQSITMSGRNYFSAKGSGSIINVVSSNLTVTGDLTVSGGDAFQGGGVKLDEYSTLFLKEPLRARFHNNRAFEGSAIYAPISKRDARRSTIQVVPNKYYNLHNINSIQVTMHFENNTNYDNAPISLYTPTLNFYFNQTSPMFKFRYLLWKRLKLKFTYTLLFDIILKGMEEIDKYTSLSNGMCVKIHGKEMNCTYTDLALRRRKPKVNYLHELSCFPGETAFSTLYTKNEVFNILRVDCSDETPLMDNVTQYLSKNDSLLSIKLRNNEKNPLCYIVSRLNTDCINTNPVSLFIQMKVTVQASCPLGFRLAEDGYCDCMLALTDHHYQCNIDTRIFTSPRGYWTGYITRDSSHKTILLNTKCPPNYCNQDFRSFDIQNDSITDLSCLNNRTGILCGQCKENYSAVFGSDACFDHCTDLYILTLPVYALAGLILVVLLFALRLTVATGTINGVIFYANLLGLLMDQLTEDVHETYISFFRIIISLVNLDLGFPLCLYDGMSTTAKIGFQFLFPLYLWGIVIGTTILSKLSVRFSNLISNNSVQVLATLFYLSFSKLLRTVIDIISYAKLLSITYYDSSNDSDVSEQTVWYYTGEDYGHGVHGFHLFLAIVFIALFLLPYAIFVTFSSFFLRFPIINEFKPFIDAYGGPFKDKWRFWFGLRLWITITLFIVNGVLQGTNTKTMLIVHLVIVMVFLLLQALCHPFKSQITGVIDLLLMMNYWLIIEFYFILGRASHVAYTFLVSTAILALFLILMFHFFCKCVYTRQLKLFFKRKRQRWERFRRYELLENNINEEDDCELFNAAAERENLIDTHQ